MRQLPTDAKVASLLAIGGLVKYKLKTDSGVMPEWLVENVVPNIHQYFNLVDETNKVAHVLALPLLWACLSDDLVDMVLPEVRARVRVAWANLRGENITHLRS